MTRPPHHTRRAGVRDTPYQPVRGVAALEAQTGPPGMVTQQSQRARRFSLTRGDVQVLVSMCVSSLEALVAGNVTVYV